MDRSEQIAALVDALRVYADEAARMDHAFAHAQGLHHTDGAALLAVRRAERAGEPLSPGRLGLELDLSSGATTAVLDRLERRGHLHRHRDRADRRRVTLYQGPAGAAVACAFAGPLVTAVGAALADYTDDELALAARFLSDMTGIATRHRPEPAPCGAES